VRGRPGLYTSYEAEAALLPTRTRKAALVLLFVVLVLMPFSMPVIDQIPFVRFLGDGPWLRVVNRALIFSIAALGLNLLAGLAGQVSLGHAFFMGVGAYTAVLMGGISTPYLWGWGLPMWLWLPASGVVAAGVGVLVAPAAVRVRGLYLAIATIGLVFIGLHLSRVFEEIAGPGALGRKWPKLQLRIWKEEEPFLDFAGNGHWLWFDVNRNQKTYFFLLKPSMKPTNHLTELSIKQAKPKEKQYKLTDGEGMYLRVYPNGSKYWQLQYWFDGKQKILSFGVWPDVSLKEAREKDLKQRKKSKKE